MRVILFDIDGTLLHSGGAGKRGMTQAFAEVFGAPDGLANIQLGGKTDPQILEIALANHNVTTDRNGKDKFKERYFELLEVLIEQDLPGKGLYPGVEEVLSRLGDADDLKLGLLTGNWQRGAQLKLGHFDLRKYFGFGAFGDDAFDRDELLPFALDRCRRDGELEPLADQTIVVGDTPSDVRCAQVHGAKALAVATGHFSFDELKASGANWIFEDLCDVDEVVSILSADSDL